MIKVQTTSIVTAPKRDPELRKAAEAFEAVILRQMMASMRKAKLGDEMFGSSATDNFREITDGKLAGKMAGLPQIGICPPGGWVWGLEAAGCHAAASRGLRVS